MTTTQTIAQLRKTGLTVLGDMPWGTHCCHFFQTRGDLLETLVPFFKVGLESKEFCLWVVHAPLTEEQARRAIRQRIAESDRYLDEGRLENVTSREWNIKGSSFSMRRVTRGGSDNIAQEVSSRYGR